MSIKKWEEIAQQKRAIETQRQRILNAFKERKIKDEMGELEAEKLFRPITKRLTFEESEELKVSLEFPNYTVDDEPINWNVLPFPENDDEDADKLPTPPRPPPDAEGPDYGIPEEDLLKDSEEDLLQEADSSFSFSFPSPPASPPLSLYLLLFRCLLYLLFLLLLLLVTPKVEAKTVKVLICRLLKDS